MTPCLLGMGHSNGAAWVLKSNRASGSVSQETHTGTVKQVRSAGNSNWTTRSYLFVPSVPALCWAWSSTCDGDCCSVAMSRGPAISSLGVL